MRNLLWLCDIPEGNSNCADQLVDPRGPPAEGEAGRGEARAPPRPPPPPGPGTPGEAGAGLRPAACAGRPWERDAPHTRPHATLRGANPAVIVNPGRNG